MKRLVLVGEGHGEVTALPILAKKILQEKDHDRLLFVDSEMIRAGGTHGLVRWNKDKKESDYSEWNRKISLAARRPDIGGVLAVFDGDASMFPAGSKVPFCPGQAAKVMAKSAADSGAGKVFSLAVVFACVEFESWIVAGIDSIAGKSPLVPKGLKAPSEHPESRGKGWLEKELTQYRPSRDQSALTDLLEINAVRAKKLRSFTRLEHAIEQILDAVRTEKLVATPSR